jgi:hypothetical protein
MHDEKVIAIANKEI